MKLSSLAVFALFLLALFVAAAPKEENKVVGLFAPLEKGQKVAVKEIGGRYEIGYVAGVELGFKIVEIGQAFIVVEDLAEATQTRIPIYSVKAITITRLPKK